MFLTSRFAFSITPPVTKVGNRTSSTYGIKSDVFDSAEEVHIFSYVGIIGWNENVLTYPDVTQFGRVLALGARCRRFKSCHPDQL